MSTIFWRWAVQAQSMSTIDLWLPEGPHRPPRKLQRETAPWSARPSDPRRAGRGEEPAEDRQEQRLACNDERREVRVEL
eukprot:2380637-Heterocapsa_arctica.AAC.1